MTSCYKMNKLKKDFPIFNNNPKLTYLDSTATSLKPKSVIDKLVEYYSQYSANIFRGVYKISEKATEEYEETRKIVADFINARKDAEIVFTRNTTESLNLIAYSLGREIVDKDDEIVTTIMEHHSNFVPWQVLCLEVGASFKVIDINDKGYLDLELDDIKYKKSNIKNTYQILKKIVTEKTKILTLTYISNVLGTINPVKEIIAAAKKINPKIITIIDAAQAVPHLKVDVQDLGCDFLVFSSHKMLGPTGVGVLWGKENLLKEMFPFMYGGEMINEVYIDRTIFKDPPHKFEAGTPAIGEVIAFKEAIKYLKTIGMDKVREHEKKLALFCLKILRREFGNRLKIFGPIDENDRGGAIAFSFGKYHPHDIASILDEEKIAVRAGHHCAMPLHNRLGVNATVRASFYIYNDENDIERLIKGLKKVEKILA
ncbi:MAG: Cysteine desulfurase, SufS subfamily [Candidatus Roizmanbacteria bacterium GW2011_GWC2_37_13]|uniref:Cysteine desulfurase n=1 Tax=Candidatus Roizmanbacteria bacterium GW2011_GWC2_37_13 TaxID=1618486 RepID=A0A0G0JEE7_9BACT|nr:MAG: Cysteine desulfurase, SufS subfamily [Candidatus Roizmanbacteria bacterium GW2011_GWC1_37_12]KKQ26546.1 MAG: Cysteine desulfurase, SufS subfamily [Candidatus Roizmanbacteria bacterium GW2011_GWC2_37_13]